MSLKGGGWRPEPEDGEFVWVIIEVYVDSELRGDRFQDVTIALMPSVMPREGEAFEESSVPFFPGLP